MDDCQASSSTGTKGIAIGVHDVASIIVRQDNGSHLNLVCGVDICKKYDNKTKTAHFARFFYMQIKTYR